MNPRALASTAASEARPGSRVETELFLRNPPLFEEVGGTAVAYRKFGAGAPLVLLHGWPFSGLTFRRIVPQLSARFTCYVIDIPGAGETRWHEGTDFRFAAQADTIRAVLLRLGLASYSLVAHDSGGTLARLLAISDRDKVEKLVLLNTEIPGHRPPWIPFYSQLLAVPFSNDLFGLLLRSRTFLRSSAGFGGCFFNAQHLDADFAACYLAPLRQARRREGLRRYLRGFEWSIVDSFARRHAEISAPVLLVWGENDPTFPVDRAREMAAQFHDCRGVRAVPRAKLLVQEERPDEVAREALVFLTAE